MHHIYLVSYNCMVYVDNTISVGRGLIFQGSKSNRFSPVDINGWLLPAFLCGQPNQNQTTDNEIKLRCRSHWSIDIRYSLKTIQRSFTFSLGLRSLHKSTFTNGIFRCLLQSTFIVCEIYTGYTAKKTRPSSQLHLHSAAPLLRWARKAAQKGMGVSSSASG